MEQIYDILSQNIIFRGLTPSEADAAMKFFSARQQIYKRGDFLHHAGERLREFGLVLSGTVNVYTDDIEGRQMLMAAVAAGDSFGESLAYLKVNESSVYICALTDCEVLWLSAERIAAGSSNSLDLEFKNRFINDLALRALAMNRRIQILSKHTLREKLITFLTDYVRKYGSAAFTVPFDRGSMATYLGADRSALSRELSAMKRDGIIDYHKNMFKFIKTPDSFD